ncbi:YdaU family protein [Acinetobacter sp. c3-l95]|uniref:YdaU family protein n=1 Tax=Acinetobacter sp. c3-l95 TaxID=3342804 RepID=UPI0035BB7122
MHYYEFSIGDYRRRTSHLTPLEHYIYRTLLDWYILDEKPLKADMNYLLRILALPKRNQDLVQNVLNDFFIEKDGFYHNKRADELLHAYHTNVENGKKGGRPPKKNDSQNKGDDKPSQSDDEPNSNPSESENKPKENPTETQDKPNQKATNNQEPLTNNINTHTNTHEQFSGQADLSVSEIQNQIADKHAPDLSLDEILKLWTPTLNDVNYWLQMAGEKAMTQTEFDQAKVTFLNYYAGKITTGLVKQNKLFGMFVSWQKRDLSKAKPIAKAKTTEKTKSNTTERNVNQAWGEPVITPLDQNIEIAIPDDWS